MASFNGLCSKHDGLHSTRADLVDCGRIGGWAETCLERDLTRWGLADTGLDDIAEVEFLDDAGINVLGCECVLEGLGSKFGGLERLQGAIEGASRRPRRSDNDGFDRLERVSVDARHIAEDNAPW